MAEPTSGITALAAAVSAGTIAVLGLPSLALLWGFLGGVAGVVLTESETRGRVSATVCMSMFVGAAAGNWFAAATGGGLPVLILGALLVGAGAKWLLSIAIAAIGARIKKAGGVE